MVSKKRRIAAKPTGQAAANWVKAGGVDPEISKSLDAQTSERLNVALPKSKSPNYVRSTIYLPKALHKQLKVAAVQGDVEMSDIAQQAIEEWMSKHLNA